MFRVDAGCEYYYDAATQVTQWENWKGLCQGTSPCEGKKRGGDGEEVGAKVGNGAD